MRASAFPTCCGMNLITDFPYDGAPGNWQPTNVAEIQTKLPVVEGGYCQAHLIALTSKQSQAALEVQAAGYVPVGSFISTHQDGTEVTLFAKGLSFKERVKYRPKKVKLRKIRALARKRG